MPNCNKIKRPCKICFETVSEKNGIQCQGACQTWVHFTCLNYTPGKIKDIKAGIIKVTCPCPDCNTTLPKEYRKDEPFSCNNTKCPANHLPKCGNVTCPINKGVVVDELPTATCALDRCGKSCKTYSHPQLYTEPEPQPIPPCAPPKYYESPSTSGSVDGCHDFNKCPSGCALFQDIPGDYGRYYDATAPSMGTLEQICATVGQLTNQINNLMSKMHQSGKDKSEGNSCIHKGPRSKCPKPCFCPGNPARKN
ncbi:uncharacterized protein LOC113402662 [Vanessa tameamea]|uniref:Uncharacterized protein LOC113402662 n=1 Tax=Vanessa tameamea TaxID=334116 RepID=A0A8B8INR0_VANTA